MNGHESTRILLPREVARELGMAERTVRRLIGDGLLPKRLSLREIERHLRRLR